MKNRKWTEDEDNKLWKHRKDGLTCEEIHKFLPERTKSAIRCRIQKLGINKIYPYTENQLKDLTGIKFGRLTVTGRAENDNTGHLRWFCDCDCGAKNILVYGQALKSKNQVSCGCYRNEIVWGKKYYNEYDLSGTYGRGYCKNTGNQFLFDLEDYEKIKDYCWMEDSNGYLVTFVNRKAVFMHRFIMDLKDNSLLEVDHIKHKTNDNRKKFLRITSHAKNHRNNKLYKNNSSGFTGVYFDYRDNVWYSRITYDGKVINLCRSKTKDDVIKARKEAEELYFGEHSYHNSMSYNPENN